MRHEHFALLCSEYIAVFVFKQILFMKLESLLTIPSIRSKLDTWLKYSEYGANQGFGNNIALEKIEAQIILLNEKFGVSLDEAFNVVIQVADAILEEIYN